MRVVEPYFQVLRFPPRAEILALLEAAGRTCYKSESSSADGSAGPFVRRIVARGHESVIEHESATVKIVCDRGVSHELVRHRLASYSQESTRYANYNKQRLGAEITVVRPPFWPDDSDGYRTWEASMRAAESSYMDLINLGASPEQARCVLPNSLKTEVVMTCNLREWRHVFKLRCSTAAHPQMRQIMTPLLEEFMQRLPEVFEDLTEVLRGQ